MYESINDADQEFLAELLMGHEDLPNSSPTTLLKEGPSTLNDEQTQVIVNEEKEDSSEDSMTTNKRKKQIAEASMRHRKRKKSELQYLRNRLKDLQSEMAQLQALAVNPVPSFWIKNAREEELKRRKSELESEFLKQELLKRMQLARVLQMHLLKYPVFNTLVPPHALRLSRTEPQRSNTITYITMRDIEDVTAVLLAAGINRTEEHVVDITVSGDGEDMEFKVAKVIKYEGYDFMQVMRATWDMSQGIIPSTEDVRKVFCFQPIAYINQDIIYGKFDYAVSSKWFQTLAVTRRHLLESEGIFVWRSVYEDEYFPHNSNNLIHQETGYSSLSTSHNDLGKTTLARTVIFLRPPAQMLTYPRDILVKAIHKTIIDTTIAMEAIIKTLLRSQSLEQTML